MADADKNPPVPLKKPDAAPIVSTTPDDPDPNAPTATTEDISGLPDVKQRDASKEIVEVQPAAADYTGTYECKRDGLIYALAIKEDNIRGKAYHARNKGFFWEGTKEEFEKQFVKV